MSVAITLYLSPNKDSFASIILLFLFLYSSIKYKKIVFPKIYFIPLILILFYSVFLAFVYNTALPYDFVKKIIIGGIVLLISINYFSGNHKDPWLLFLYIMVLPGFVHILYMYYDIYKYVSTTTDFQWSYLKECVRVGRRYLSTAIISLLLPFFIIGGSSKKILAKSLALAGFVVSLISLGLLDTRAAYIVTIIILIGPLFFTKTRLIYLSFIRNWQLGIPFFKAILVLAFAITFLIAYKTGETRWEQFSQSLNLAIKPDLTKSNSRNSIFVNEAFWNTPYSSEEHIQCTQERSQRCITDQSIYLRSYWLINSLKVFHNHPLGVGYRPEFASSLQSSTIIVSNEAIPLGGAGDSFLVETILSFGFIGLLLYVWFFALAVLPYYKKNIFDEQNLLGTACFFMCIACIFRMILDAFNDGLWCYFMIIFGVLIAQINKTDSRMKCDF